MIRLDVAAKVQKKRMSLAEQSVLIQQKERKFLNF